MQKGIDAQWTAFLSAKQGEGPKLWERHYQKVENLQLAT